MILIDMNSTAGVLERERLSKCKLVSFLFAPCWTSSTILHLFVPSGFSPYARPRSRPVNRQPDCCNVHLCECDIELFFWKSRGLLVGGDSSNSLSCPSHSCCPYVSSTFILSYKCGPHCLPVLLHRHPGVTSSSSS